jgi:hypothetical protein
MPVTVTMPTWLTSSAVGRNEVSNIGDVFHVVRPLSMLILIRYLLITTFMTLHYSEAAIEPADGVLWPMGHAAALKGS